LKSRKVYRLILGIGLTLVMTTPINAQVSLSDLWQPAHMLSCVSFEIVGICFDPGPPPRIGIKIRMWRPELIVETVKRPGDSVMPIIGDTVNKMCAEALKSVTKVLPTSGSTTSYGPQSNLQFNEVHVYDYPFKNWLAGYFFGLWCYAPVEAIGSQAFFRYLTELDFLEWRFGGIETIVRAPWIIANIICSAPVPGTGSICMGRWGAIYPRVGAFPHQSEVVGSAADSFRAVSNTSLLDLNFHHIRISPLWWRPSTADKLQMIYPTPSGCIHIGEIPLLWETAKTSITGKYLWLYWRHVDCCIF